MGASSDKSTLTGAFFGGGALSDKSDKSDRSDKSDDHYECGFSIAINWWSDSSDLSDEVFCQSLKDLRGGADLL